MKAFFAVVFAVAVMGCDSTGPDSDPVGRYHMVSFNAKPLPITESGATLTSELLRLLDDGTFIVTVAFRVDGENHTERETGTWVHEGGSITFADDEGDDPIVADYTGSKITIDDGEDVLVFERD